MNKIQEILQEKDIGVFLPANGGKAIIEYIGKTMPDIPIEYSALVFYTKVAQVMSLHRTLVHSNFHVRDGKYGRFVNMYSILFMKSGIGKDRVADLVSDEFMKDVRLQFKKYYDNRRNTVIDNLIAEANDLFPVDKKRKNEYVRVNEPHSFSFEMNRGTPQGVYSFRKSLKDVGIGCLTFQHSEFADYFLSHDETHQAFLDIMKDGYEGDTKAGVLKTEKNLESVYGVPMNMLVHTVNFGFIDIERVKDQLYSFFNRGYARRAMMCIAERNPTGIPEDIDGFIENENNMLEEMKLLLPDIQNDFNELYSAISSMKIPVYTLTNDADRLLTEYDIYLKRLSIGKTQDHVNAEINGRKWRAMKLSAIMSAYEFPKETNVGASFVESAIAFVEFYGRSFKKFFDDANEEDFQKLLDFLMDRKGEWVSKDKIKAAGLVGKNRFAEWMSDNISLVSSALFDTVYDLVVEKNGSRGEKYRIVEKSKVIEESEQDAKQRIEERLDRVRDNT